MIALADLDPAQRAVVTRAAKAAREVRRLQEAHPLAFARLWVPECPKCLHPDRSIASRAPWHRGQPLHHLDGLRHQCPTCGDIHLRTSQLQAVRLMLGMGVSGRIAEAYLLGGNRTGKTEGVAQVTVAMGLGSDDPSVQRWAAINGLDLSGIPGPPGRAWAIAQTFGAAREYVRPKLDRYLPAGTLRRAWGADNEAEAITPTGAVFMSKAVEQARASKSGRNPFEGAAIRVGWFDEEPHVKIAVESTSMRLVDQRGPMLFSMTPLSGWTPFLTERIGWMRDGKPAPDGVVLSTLHGEHNPHIDARQILQRLARMPEPIRRARLRGEITAMEGRVHEEWDRAIHVVKAFEPPADWPRFGGIDFGFRNPFVHLWCALDRSDDVLHVYREHYQRETLITDHARAIAAHEWCSHCRPSLDILPELLALAECEWATFMAQAANKATGCQKCDGTGRAEPWPHERWADPEDKSQRETLNLLGIENNPARKDRRPSFDALWARTSVDGAGRAHLVVHDCCTNTIGEIEQLTWADNRKDPDRMETQGEDHAHDVIRYICYGLVRSGWSTLGAEGG